MKKKLALLLSLFLCSSVFASGYYLAEEIDPLLEQIEMENLKQSDKNQEQTETIKTLQIQLKDYQTKTEKLEKETKQFPALLKKSEIKGEIKGIVIGFSLGAGVVFIASLTSLNK